MFLSFQFFIAFFSTILDRFWLISKGLDPCFVLVFTVFSQGLNLLRDSLNMLKNDSKMSPKIIKKSTKINKKASPKIHSFFSSFFSVLGSQNDPKNAPKIYLFCILFEKGRKNIKKSWKKCPPGVLRGQFQALWGAFGLILDDFVWNWGSIWVEFGGFCMEFGVDF